MQPGQGERKQLVVLAVDWEIMLHQTHTPLWADHQGRSQTLARVLAFFWPGVSQKVIRFCRTCPQCQVGTWKGSTTAPLTPMPVSNTTFDHIVLDFVGPLCAGHHNGLCNPLS